LGHSPWDWCVGCERCHRKTEIEAETKFYSLSRY
jgi:hypothetical protein